MDRCHHWRPMWNCRGSYRLLFQHKEYEWTKRTTVCDPLRDRLTGFRRIVSRDAVSHIHEVQMDHMGPLPRCFAIRDPKVEQQANGNSRNKNQVSRKLSPTTIKPFKVKNKKNFGLEVLFFPAFITDRTLLSGIACMKTHLR